MNSCKTTAGDPAPDFTTGSAAGKDAAARVASSMKRATGVNEGIMGSEFEGRSFTFPTGEFGPGFRNCRGLEVRAPALGTAYPQKGEARGTPFNGDLVVAEIMRDFSLRRA